MSTASTAESVEQPRAKASRMANIERLRMLAILDIIGFHATPGDPVRLAGGTGLYLFLLMGAVFNVTVARNRGLRQFSLDKLNRLMVPWLFWVGFYGVLKALDGFESTGDWTSQFDGWMLLYGTRAHLWFVPFTTVSGILVGWLYFRLKSVREERLLPPFVAVGIVLLVVGTWTAATYEPPLPIPQYLISLATPFLGFALARGLFPDDREKRATLIPPLVIGMAAFGALFYFLELPNQAEQTCMAFVMVTVAVLWPGPQDRFVKVVTPCMFGIYLIHPFSVRILGRFDWLYAPTGMRYLDIGIFSVACFFLALGLIWLMRQTPLKRFT